MHHPDNFEISCSNTIKSILCEAIQNYSFRVLPKADDNNLLLIINHIEEYICNGDQPSFIDGVLQNYCYDAINYHYDRIRKKLNANVDEQRKLMLNMLDGVPTHDHQLDTALLKDNIF